jgi:5-(carboxyamino)imidazole ribonucleotide mutase
MDAGSLKGMDALLSTVQMPGGIPVACVAIGKAGAKNAGYLAAQILALQDPDLTQHLMEERVASAEAIKEKDSTVQKQLTK